MDRHFVALDAHIFCGVFFFFQAEDCIRDINVTGVQTCALPIFQSLAPASEWIVKTHDRAVAINEADEVFIVITQRSSDRKSVVQAKSVELGGRQIIKNKKIKAYRDASQ